MGRFRSVNAILTPDHPLWDGCKLALLGQHAGGLKAWDSSAYGNHGTLTNMDPATDWVTNTALGRRGPETDGTNEYVDLGHVNVSGSWSAASWIYAAVLATAKLAIFDNLNASGFADGVTFVAGNAQTSNRSLGIYSAATGWRITSTELPAAATLSHVAVSVDAAVGVKFYINGKLDQSHSDTSSSAVQSSVIAKVGRAYNDNYVASQFFDTVAFDRAITASDVATLASPDPMLHGALWVPSSRLTFWTGGAAPATTPWLYARRQSQIIGSGLGV